MAEFNNLGDVRTFLSGLPDETEVMSWQLDKSDFVVIVDSNGNAQRIATNKHRWLSLHVLLPAASN